MSPDRDSETHGQKAIRFYAKARQYQTGPVQEGEITPGDLRRWHRDTEIPVVPFVSRVSARLGPLAIIQRTG